MTPQSTIPVKAAHDLLQRFSPPIKAGTPGEIVSMTGTGLYSYTVTFSSPDLIGGSVTLRDLCRTDLQEA
jgi:hypothetical protein